MSEKSLSAEALKVTEFVSEPLYVRQPRAAPPDNQETPNEPASEKPVINPGEAPDGGLTAWLVVIA
jgi:hypothetical protein